MASAAITVYINRLAFDFVKESRIIQCNFIIGITGD